LSAPKSTFTADLTAGTSYSRAAGTEHDVINSNTFEFVFIEVERK
jgi:beta-alanine degradation protein BauB